MDKTLIERAIDSAKHRQYKLSADLKRDISDGHRKKAEKQKEVAEVTVMALERMMPKRPLYDGNNWYRCVNCCEVHKKQFEKDWYCPKCGQRIDWGNDMSIIGDILEEHYEKELAQAREKAIDEFAEQMKTAVNENYFFAGEFKAWTLYAIDEVAERMKGEGNA